MNSNDNIQNELNELNSLLAGISNKNIYTVPDGYFDVLSHDVLLAVQQKGMEATGNSNVPEGYFEGLADTILGKIKAGADAEEPVLLANTRDINVYRVPSGYFDNLAAGIVSKLPQPAKVVVMRRRSSFFNYAAAAVITGIIGLSVMSVFNKKQTDNSLTSTTDETAMVNNILEKKSVDEVLSTLRDDDIVNYLQKSGQDVDAALVASIADDKNLPEAIDYLTNDKTLDNLLNELKAGKSTDN